MNSKLVQLSFSLLLPLGLLADEQSPAPAPAPVPESVSTKHPVTAYNLAIQYLTANADAAATTVADLQGKQTFKDFLAKQHINTTGKLYPALAALIVQIINSASDEGVALDPSNATFVSLAKETAAQGMKVSMDSLGGGAATVPATAPGAGGKGNATPGTDYSANLQKASTALANAETTLASQIPSLPAGNGKDAATKAKDETVAAGMTVQATHKTIKAVTTALSNKSAGTSPDFSSDLSHAATELGNAQTSLKAAVPAFPDSIKSALKDTPDLLQTALDSINPVARDMATSAGANIYIPEPAGEGGFRLYTSEGVRVLNPYTITSANNLLTLQTTSSRLKGFVQFNIDSTWAWDASREKRSANPSFYNASYNNHSNYPLDYSDAGSPFTFALSLDPYHWFVNGFDTRFDLGFNFANGSTPTTSTVTSGGDIYAETVLEKHIFRGLVTPYDLNAAYSCNFFYDLAANTDRDNFRVNKLQMIGIDGVLGWQPPITASGSSTPTVPERGLFRVALGWANFQNVRFNPPSSLNVVGTNGGTTPAFFSENGLCAKIELMYPVTTDKFLTVGGFEVLRNIKPASWTFYVGYTIGPSDIAKMFMPATPAPTAPTKTSSN